LPVFISYSHEDAKFAHKLGLHLVRNNAHVWIDEWELNVGDSILARVQCAIQESSALLILLSKASVQSEWCKKELSAGLMRELDEKRVLVLPVLLEDCEMPIFLREKMYADFRTNFDVGLRKLVDALLKVTSLEQSRIVSGTGHIDWSEDWGYEGGRFRMDFTLVEHWDMFPFTLLTQISLRGNDALTRRYDEYKKAGLGWLGRLAIVEELAAVAASVDIKILLEDAKPKTERHLLVEEKTKTEYRIIITSRRMGEDNGKDQLVNVGNYLRQIRDYVRQGSRKPTPEETARLRQILAPSDAARPGRRKK
jgi:hypothetical protein